jgi:hypothetical protein
LKQFIRISHFRTGTAHPRNRSKNVKIEKVGRESKQNFRLNNDFFCLKPKKQICGEKKKENFFFFLFNGSNAVVRKINRAFDAFQLNKNKLRI